MKKHKILMLSDHPLSYSGVGTQSYYLINGLVETGKYSFRCFGGALKHTNYDVIKVNDDFIVKPTDGFGNPEMIRHVIATEDIDAILLFTDPRFFMWLFDMHDEIHNAGIPILYNTIWDARPTPRFQEHRVYKSCDLLNCISKLTYDMLTEMRPEITNYVPHAVPEETFFPMSEEERKQYKQQLIGKDRKDHFVGLWINRNAKRKRPNDLLLAWKMFLDKMEENYGHRNATLILHTQPVDDEGVNLFATAEHLGIVDNLFFSKEFLQYEQINVLHNISDFCVNVSLAEGHGLPTMQSMQCGVPIIAPLLGGQQTQVVNPETGEEHGVAMPIDFKTLVGSVQVNYIYEEYSSLETIVNSFYKMYEFGPAKRKELGELGRKYVKKNFNMANLVKTWDETIEETLKNWKKRRPAWELKEM